MLTTTAAKNASLSGAKNGDATSTAIRCAPAGSLATRGAESQEYRRFANGRKAASTTASPTTPRRIRLRSSSRWSNRWPSASGAAMVVIARGARPGRRVVGGRGTGQGRVIPGGTGLHPARGPGQVVVDRAQAAAHVFPGLADAGVQLVGGFACLPFEPGCGGPRRVQVALEFLGGQFALQLGAHRIPLCAGAAHPEPGEACRPGQALGAQ